MTTRINRKHGVPRIHGGQPFSFSRGKFLDGTIKTYYGPGQPPDAGESDGYQPPGDWPAAGCLLRVPQVCWLTLAVESFDFNDPGPLPVVPHTSYFKQCAVGLYPAILEFWASGDDAPIYPDVSSVSYTVVSATDPTAVVSVLASAEVDLFGAIVGAYTPNPDGPLVSWSSSPSDPGPYYTESITCPYPAEYARIKGIFEEAKARIEALRPNRTWVEINDPWNWAVVQPPPAGDNRKFFLGIAPEDACYWPMIAPADATGSFFGVNFLHVYAGSPNDTLLGPVQFEESDPDTLDVGFARLVAAAPKFAGFALRCYGLKVDFDHFPAATAYAWSPPAEPTLTVSESHYEGGDFFHPGTLVTGTKVIPMHRLEADSYYDGIYADQATTFNLAISNLNDANDHADDAGRTFLAGLCETLAAEHIDAAYVDDAPTLTADSLVALIADHYGFDPSTGLDLG